MYRIGEFSILNKISIKTLRYYDSIGLFKPNIIDKYTGYRYYDDTQIEELKRILSYKDLGFSLEEIKKLNTEDKNKTIIDKIDSLLKEISDCEIKIKRLSKMVKIEKIEFRYYQHNKCLVKFLQLKNRDVEDEYKKIKEELISKGLKPLRRIFDNCEIGYTTNNIDALIGYEVEHINEEIDGYEVINSTTKAKQIVGHGKIDEIDNIYQEMILYAHNNNIQIRGNFVELYNEDNDDIDIYVEAFDLNEVNEDYLHYLKTYKIETEIDERLIGKYKIKEILPGVRYIFNPNKQKSIPDTKYEILELNKDGTTNYDNITWNKKALIFKYEDQNIPLPIHILNIDNNYYLEILANESYEYYKSQRPMVYIYERY